jgi:hypothetical protein
MATPRKIQPKLNIEALAINPFRAARVRRCAS